jgi:hypothetical protein
MHFSLYILAAKFIVVVLFCVCEEQEAVNPCRDSEYFSVFGYNFQISNHRPILRALSYKKYFTYYTGCMFIMCFSPVFLCFYVQSLFAAITQKVKDNIRKSCTFLLYIPENITPLEMQNSESRNIKKVWCICVYIPFFKGLGE